MMCARAYLLVRLLFVHENLDPLDEEGVRLLHLSHAFVKLEDYLLELVDLPVFSFLLRLLRGCGCISRSSTTASCDC